MCTRMLLLVHIAAPPLPAPSATLGGWRLPLGLGALKRLLDEVMQLELAHETVRHMSGADVGVGQRGLGLALEGLEGLLRQGGAEGLQALRPGLLLLLLVEVS